MKTNAAYAYNDLQSLGDDANSAAVVLSLPTTLKLYNANSTAGKKVEQLTPREIEVLQLIASDKLNKQIAATLGISPKTVEKHRGHIRSKLCIHGTAGLTHFAIFAGIISCDPVMVMAEETTNEQ